MDKVTIIGAGPSGLFSAYLLLKEGYEVHLYDQMSGVGKKFLVAGHGGLNLTHSENVSLFTRKYGKHHDFFTSLLHDFSNDDLRSWCHELGVETFVGSSGRIFPKTFKAADILKRWLDHLKDHERFHLHLRHRLISLEPMEGNIKKLMFERESEQVTAECKIVILSMGGASWSKTGSDGNWASMFKARGHHLVPFRPMNCGFEVHWSEFMKNKLTHLPLKNIELSFEKEQAKGEMMLTPYGIEGGAVYALSRNLVSALSSQDSAIISIDLKPSMSGEDIEKLLVNKKSKESMSNFFRKTLKLAPISMSLLRECFANIDDKSNRELTRAIKSVPIKVTKPRPIDEAISTSGGVALEDLSEHLELSNLPGVYIAGEMLDFDASTGGYLLQGCFSSAFRVVKGICSS